MQSDNVVDLREALSHRAEPAPRQIDPDDWRRDVWDLVKLGVGVRGRGQRFMDFQRLPQP